MLQYIFHTSNNSLKGKGNLNMGDSVKEDRQIHQAHENSTDRITAGIPTQ